MSPSITEDDAIAALRDFLLLVLPSGIEVVQGQDNYVPEPAGPNHIILTPASRTHLSSSYREPRPDDDAVLVSRSTRIDIQMDVYGPNGSDYAQVISTLLRDDYGCQAMAGTGVQPLYCDDGQQMPLVNGEKQYEQRWRLHAQLQIDPTVSTPAQFADMVELSIVEAD